MHTLANCICIAFVLAERSRSAPQVLESPQRAWQTSPERPRLGAALEARLPPAPALAHLTLVVGVTCQKGH
eukprot:6188085-Pleurochrysis_carterae.AAC.3